MCFDLDSRPPIAPIDGGALDGAHITLTAEDGTRFAGFRARPTTPSGVGILILPDVRGLHTFYEELALRFAEHGMDALAIDYFGRTTADAVRDDDFDYMAHVQQTTWAGMQADIRAGASCLRTGRDDRPAPSSLFTVGFCAGGRMSFLSATLGLSLAGVIGFYGTLLGPWRNDAPAPVDEVSRMQSPVLGLFGGDDGAITTEAIDAFESGLSAAGVDHRLVTYPGAPHSFFDRKAAEFADASAAAWTEVLSFVEARTA